jgi:hypothetical protein
MNHMGELCPGPEALAGWLEQRLPAPERAKVTSHLASCDDCRRAVTIASAVEPQPAGAVNEILLHRVVKASQRRPVAAFITAAAAVLVAAILFWPRPQKPQPPVAVSSDAPAPAPVPKPEDPTSVPEVKKQPETPAPVTPEVPAPAPEKKPEPATSEPPKEDPKKTVVAADNSKPSPAVPPKEDPVPAVKKQPGHTEVDVSGTFASVFVLDPSGDLWLNRQGAEAAPVARFEQVGYKDTLSTHAAPGAFALEGKATLALEKNTSATVAWKPMDKVYALTVAQGSVMVDTESSQQSWKISTGGKSEFVLSNVNGRFVVEPRGEQLGAVMLSGRTDVKTASATRHVDADRAGARDLVATAEGKISEEAAKQTKKYAPLSQHRPKEITVFAATFKDKEKDEPLPFAYTTPTGKVVTENGFTALRVEVPLNAYPKPGEKVIASCSVRPERPIEVSSTLVLRFRYRTNLSTFTVRLGDYTAVFTSHAKATEWGTGELPLESFSSQGVFLSRAVLAQLSEIQFQAVADGKKSSNLDLDGIQFLKRSR